jgi:integrase
MPDDMLTFRKSEKIHEAIVEGRLNFEDAVNLVLLIMFLYMDEMKSENYMAECIGLQILDIARDKCMTILNDAWVQYFHKITRERIENEN